MIKFIKLNECIQDGTREVLVNVSCIEYISKGKKTNDTYIKLTGYPKQEGGAPKFSGFFFVVETLEEIESLILTDGTRTPVIMSAEEAAKLNWIRSGRPLHKGEA